MGMGFAPTWLRRVTPPASQNHFNHWISTVVMFQTQNTETKNRTLKTAVSSKIIMTTSIIMFHNTTQNLQDQDKTTMCKTETKTFFDLRPVLS